MQNRFDDIMNQLGWFYLDDDVVNVEVDQLDDVERTLGYALPDDYRTFLMKYGITSVADDVLITSLEGDNSSFDVFYGVKTHDSYDLRERKLGFADLLPSNVIPIASASGGQVCLSLGDQAKADVTWWYPHDDYDDAPDEQFELLATSFSRFLSILKRM